MNSRGRSSNVINTAVASMRASAAPTQSPLGGQFAVRHDIGDLHCSDRGFVLGLDC